MRLRKEGKFVFVGVKISQQQEVFLTEERPYPHLLLHRSAGADIGFSNQNAFLAPGHFLSTNTKFQIRSRKPEGYRPG